MLPEEAIQWIQQTDWESALKKAASWLTAGVGGTVDLVVNTVSSVFSSVVNLALAFVFSIYLLLSKEKIGRQMKRLFQVYLKPNIEMVCTTCPVPWMTPSTAILWASALRR